MLTLTDNKTMRAISWNPVSLILKQKKGKVLAKVEYVHTLIC